MRAFEVVLVPFPFVDGPDEKVRPAILISKPELVATTGVGWFVMVTSTALPMLRGDHEIVDLRVSGLDRPCRARTSKMFALLESKIVERIGVLGSTDAIAVAGLARSWLAEPS